MANTYIHLDSVDTLEEYRHKLENWKRETIYKLWNEIRLYHESLEQDERWYGQSHGEFKEKFIDTFYDKYMQPLAQEMMDAKEFLQRLQVRAEEIGVK